LGFTKPSQGFYFLCFNSSSVSKNAQLITSGIKQSGSVVNYYFTTRLNFLSVDKFEARYPLRFYTAMPLCTHISLFLALTTAISIFLRISKNFCLDL
jgi:hypothetical protein